MTQAADTKRSPRKRVAALLALGAVGIAALVVALSSTGGASGHAASHRTAGTVPTAALASKPNTRVAGPNTAPTPGPVAGKPASHPTAPPPVANSGNGIPQNNAGDGDPDNNGGPSDGDGNI